MAPIAVYATIRFYVSSNGVGEPEIWRLCTWFGICEPHSDALHDSLPTPSPTDSARNLLLEVRQKVLTELGNFGRDYRPAIGLILIVREILLMVVFGAVENAERSHFRHNRGTPQVLPIQLRNCLFSRGLLFRRMVLH